MNSVELGKRIKEARIAKKMTQSEVVGNFITRNMLSQIESGTANPSIKTLEYLAGVLELPIMYLVNDEDEASVLSVCGPEHMTTLNCAKDAYKSGDYLLTIEKLSSYAEDEGSVIYDEAAALLARSYIAKAEISEKNGELQAAAAYAKKASELADAGVYKSREVRTNAVLLLDRLAEKLAGGR